MSTQDVPPGRPPCDRVPLGHLGFPTVVAEPICRTLAARRIAFESEPPYDPSRGVIAWPLTQRILGMTGRGVGRRRFALRTSQRTVLVTVCRDDLAAARLVAQRYADEATIGPVRDA